MSQKNRAVGKYGEVFQHVENILHSGLCTYYPESGDLVLSQGVYDLAGVEGISLSETFLLQYIDTPDLLHVQSVIDKVRAGEPFLPFEFSITDARGLKKRIYVEGRLMDEDGPVHFCVLKDITESYFYKQALEQKITQLDKSNKNLQEFVYVASHDLQEPLRKIYTFTERLEAKFRNQLGTEGGMFVTRIMASTRNMQILLEDLLSFSRLSFGDKQFSQVSLQTVMNEVLGDLEVKIEESRAVISVAPLPSIEAYASQIKQLFNNLIGNAIKFRKPDEPPTIIVSCSTVTASDYPDLPLSVNSIYVQLEFSDQGIGFDQEFSERIFQIFQRLNGKAEYSGSGVGLAICKKIVDNHYGFIFAQGMSNEGAKFTVLLPQKQS